MNTLINTTACLPAPHTSSQALTKSTRTTPNPVLGKALALGAPPKPTLAADPAAPPAPGRVSGDIGLPVRSRTPGDLWIWGSPTAADRATDGSRESGRIAAMRFREPHLVQETKQLDVLKARPACAAVVLRWFIWQLHCHSGCNDGCYNNNNT